MSDIYMTKDGVMKDITDEYNNILNRYIDIIEKSISDCFTSISKLLKNYYALTNKLDSSEGYTIDDIIQGELIILNIKLCFRKMEESLEKDYVPSFLKDIVAHNTTRKLVRAVEENEQYLLYKGQEIQKDLGIRKLRRYGYDILGWYQKK